MSTQLQYGYCSPHQQIARTPPDYLDSKFWILEARACRLCCTNFLIPNLMIWILCKCTGIGTFDCWPALSCLSPIDKNGNVVSTHFAFLLENDQQHRTNT